MIPRRIERIVREALDRQAAVALVGPRQVGKTTLAQVVANELGVDFKPTSAPALDKPKDLAGVLTTLRERSVLFIDEIHRLKPAIEEMLYIAMEDYELDLVIGEGPSARSVKITLNPFTLVGATTRSGLITTPLRERFGIPLRLQFYTPEELERIVRRGAGLLELELTATGAAEIARRARGTPRIANRLLRRVRDFAEVEGDGRITQKIADRALSRLEVDAAGLDPMDRKILSALIDKFGGGPVGLNTIAAAISEEKDAIEDIYEPFLIQAGFLDRTPRGRVATPLAYGYFGLHVPAEQRRDSRLW